MEKHEMTTIVVKRSKLSLPRKPAPIPRPDVHAPESVRPAPPRRQRPPERPQARPQPAGKGRSKGPTLDALLTRLRGRLVDDAGIDLRVPFSIGIREQILALQKPGLSPGFTANLIGRVCRHPTYARLLSLPQIVRFDVHGQAAGVVSAEEAALPARKWVSKVPA